MPVYHTAPLTTYDPALQSLAADLFRRAAARIPAAHCIPHTGSYSFTGVSLPQTVAKIVIYQSTVGSGSAGASGPFPPLADGVYLFVRANAPASPYIWVPDMQTVVFL
jgi:hypothetical protein